MKENNNGEIKKERWRKKVFSAEFLSAHNLWKNFLFTLQLQNYINTMLRIL